ncbi:MAG TPA: hypothetical protein VGL66_06655 [Caulobacteraceae bacterium]|jgi:hypothetical protein
MLLRIPTPDMGSLLSEPSPLLAHLAGVFAPRVAALWRAPHAAFVTASAERRHLVCVALAQEPVRKVLLSKADADALLHRSFTGASAIALAKPPPGLRRALGRLGERAWSPEDYNKLVALLDTLASAKAIRHAGTITPSQVRALTLLPPTLLRGRTGGLKLAEHQAVLLKETYDVIRQTRGEDDAEQALVRWSKAASVKGLFETALDDLYPELPAPPFPGTARLRAITTKAGVREAALRYRNCLRNQMRYATSGESAFYEWTGDPGAVIDITRDPLYGWRLNEGKLARNAAIGPEQRREIAAELRAMGVAVGRTHWSLENDLSNAHMQSYRPETEEEMTDGAF